MVLYTLITCNDVQQAYIYKGVLEAEGIQVTLHNENFSTLMSGLNQDVAGVNLLVDEQDLDVAREILREHGDLPQ